MPKNVLYGVALTCLLSIAAPGAVSAHEAANGAAVPSHTVEHAGSLGEVFSGKDLKGKVLLGALIARPNLYALGPLEGLRGEILIWDSVPYVSSVRNGAVIVEKRPSARAAFLVWAQVREWQEVAVPDNVRSYEELERFVAQALAAVNPNGAGSFPFLLKGEPAKVAYHVVNLPDDGGPATHDRVEATDHREVITGRQVEILGFYSTGHKGVFTQHSTNMHLHVKTVGADRMGHLDDIVLRGGARLYLPQT